MWNVFVGWSTTQPTKAKMMRAGISPAMPVTSPVAPSVNQRFALLKKSEPVPIPMIRPPTCVLLIV